MSIFGGMNDEHIKHLTRKKMDKQLKIKWGFGGFSFFAYFHTRKENHSLNIQPFYYMKSITCTISKFVRWKFLSRQIFQNLP